MNFHRGFKLWSKAPSISPLSANDQGVFEETKNYPIRNIPVDTFAILVASQIPWTEPDESMAFRGDPNTTTLIVENPEARAREITEEIRRLNSNGVEMKRLDDGSIQLKTRDSQHVQDYLLAQRIEAIAVEGIIKISVIPNKK